MTTLHTAMEKSPLLLLPVGFIAWMVFYEITTYLLRKKDNTPRQSTFILTIIHMLVMSALILCALIMGVIWLWP